MLCAAGLYSQQVPREQVIAAYVYNFSQNILWPDEQKIAEFHFTVITRNRALIDELTLLSSKKRLRNKPIRITAEDRLTTTKNVQLVFIAKDREESVVDVFDRIEGKNILLVTEQFGDKKVVMINFYATEDQKLKFEINKANIINQELRILPDMVLLGGSEIDVAALYRESQQSLRSVQKKLDTLQEHQRQLEQKIEASKVEIASQQHLITTQTAAIDSHKFQLETQKLTLQQLISDIDLKQTTLNRQTEILNQRDQELREQKKEIAKGEDVLAAQQARIDSQNAEIEKQSQSLQKQDVTISTQQHLLYFFIVIILLIIGLLFSIYRGDKNKKIINARLTQEIEERKKVEEALGKSEDLYNHAPCGYHSLDPNGVFVRMNDTELEWLGYCREDVVGKMKFTDLVTDKGVALFGETFPKFKVSGAIRDLEFTLVRKDKTFMHVLLSGTAIRDSDGNFLMSRSTVYDMTDRKRAEKEIAKYREHLEELVTERTQQLRDSEQHYRQLYETMLQGVVYQDAGGKVISMNPAAERILGIPLAEMAGQTSVEQKFRMLREDGSEFPAQDHPALVTLETGREIHGVVMAVYNPQAQEYRWISISAVPIFKAGRESPTQVYTLFDDITERKRAEEQIRTLNQDLQERALALETANRELEAFAYSVSHDLRSPLRSIDGFSQVVIDEYRDRLDERAISYLRRVRNGAQNMSQLIDDMLNLSRVSRGEMNITHVNLSALCREIAAELQESYPDRKVEFLIQDGIDVRGDSRLLRIGLENLLGNAWKFTSMHPSARIEFGLDAQYDPPVYFVRDDGAGFNMNFAQKLFGAFQRLHTAAEFPGTGVGLATVQRIIRRHGGTVWAEGEVERGATIYFTLPRGA
ncbi:MAG TPA: YfiR/HmsC family protein [Bacteroidota bacterium]|nr:YfiR/HmsC family protein [Bacteroidota bacterium]